MWYVTLVVLGFLCLVTAGLTVAGLCSLCSKRSRNWDDAAMVIILGPVTYGIFVLIQGICTYCL